MHPNSVKILVQKLNSWQICVPVYWIHKHRMCSYAAKIEFCGGSCAECKVPSRILQLNMDGLGRRCRSAHFDGISRILVKFCRKTKILSRILLLRLRQTHSTLQKSAEESEFFNRSAAEVRVRDRSLPIEQEQVC